MSNKMTRKIDYVFSSISPFAYLGHAVLIDIAERYNTTINFKPVKLVKLFSQTGGLPFPERHPARQKYTLYELKRWRETRNIKMKMRPTHWPFNNSLVDRIIIAAGIMEHNQPQFIFNILKAGWTDDRNLTDKGDILEIVTENGISANDCFEKAESEEVREIYENNTVEAIQNGCFGSPTYFLDGEIFFGQDLLGQLEEALNSGRAPIIL